MKKTNWIFEGRAISSLADCPPDSFGFVYRIDFEDGTFYIGSKQLYSVGKKKISKKRANELYSGKGRKPTKEAYKKESNFTTYTSSSKSVNEKLLVVPATFSIIAFYNSKKDMLIGEAFSILQGYFSKAPMLNEWVSLRQRF